MSSHRNSLSFRHLNYQLNPCLPRNSIILHYPILCYVITATMTTFSLSSIDGQTPLNRCLDTTDGQAQWFAIINQLQPSESLIEWGVRDR